MPVGGATGLPYTRRSADGHHSPPRLILITMPNRTAALLLMIATAFVCSSFAEAQDNRGEQKTSVATSQLFHARASQKAGLLIPLYIYPENVHTNDSWNRVMDLKRTYAEVPFWVIVNPASGPGNAVDANYTKGIDRLIGAGCVVLGYVSTSYGKRDASMVQEDLATWRKLYPRVHGVFFDEMVYDDKASGVDHQVRLNEMAHVMGYWPTVGNPGTDTPGRYFADNAADVIVIHEAKEWPTEQKLHGNYFGGYSDYPPFTRATLMYGQNKLDAKTVQATIRHARWIYVTQDTYFPNDAANPNPWDELSVHLEDLCRVLDE